MASQLVTDCPRCRAQKITFDLTQANYIEERYEWQRWYEAFCTCRHCGQSTIFVLSQKVDSDIKYIHNNGLLKLNFAINKYMDIERFVNISDLGTIDPPKHLPTDIESAFIEGTKSLSIGCNNAAGTMFRLCIDIATRSLLPDEDENGLDVNTRRFLGRRLPWLLANGYLSKDLEELLACIKEDGNDGAHVGNLQKTDAEDLLDFTVELLERIYTRPQRIKLAKERRDSRRN